MHADWSVACGADDPMVVVPWAGVSRSSEEGPICYIDLRKELRRVNEIPEASQHACVAVALRRWNQQDSPLFTAKCDVWNYPADLFDAEDLAGFPFAQGSYIDLLPRDARIFSSFSACEGMLRAWTERARAIAIPEGRCEWTLRPARIFSTAAKPINSSLADPHTDGFATTLYVWGYGASPAAAANAWSDTLMALIGPVLLSKPDLQ
jgi:hypothetical protein